MYYVTVVSLKRYLWGQGLLMFYFDQGIIVYKLCLDYIFFMLEHESYFMIYEGLKKYLNSYYVLNVRL